MTTKFSPNDLKRELERGNFTHVNDVSEWHEMSYQFCHEILEYIHKLEELAFSEKDEIEYYYCKKFGNFYYITPKKHFNKTGYLLDEKFELELDNFERVEDSCFQYLGKDNPEDYLIAQDKFAYRDMIGEIENKYLKDKCRR